MQDTRYFALRAAHDGLPVSQHSQFRTLTWNELAWHRTRLRSVIAAYRVAFPDAALMFRLGQPHSSNNAGGNVGVFQLNQSIRFVMGELGVPIFECESALVC